MSAAPQIVEVREVAGATVRIGWFSRAQVFIYRYDDGGCAIGYPLPVGSGSSVIVPLEWIYEHKGATA